MFKKSIFTLLALVLVLSACSPAAATPEAMMDKPADTMVEQAADTAMEEPTVTMMEKPADAMLEKPTEEAMMSPESATQPEMAKDEMTTTPAWFSTTLTDVRTDQKFTINDFKGKVVLVETLAMWCPSCKRQQGQVKAFREASDTQNDLVTIGLDIAPNENAADLKAYTDNNGFDWIYAIAPAEAAREIGILYGDQFLNPPATPILVIDRQGQAHPMPFGIKSADELMKFIEPFLQAGM